MHICAYNIDRTERCFSLKKSNITSNFFVTNGQTISRGKITKKPRCDRVLIRGLVEKSLSHDRKTKFQVGQFAVEISSVALVTETLLQPAKSGNVQCRSLHSNEIIFNHDSLIIKPQPRL